MIIKTETYFWNLLHNFVKSYSTFPVFPLIPSNVMRALRGVERWWSRSDGKGLLDHLTIPKSKQDEIRSKSEAETEQKRQSVSYWLNTDPLASWRRLITVLDGMSETKIADSLRFNAEPLTGENVL